MSTPRAIALLAGLAAAALAVPARADIPPDPDSPDAHCTPAEQCPSGVYCDYAFRPGDPEGDWKNVGADCRRDAQARGLERRCRNGGNYSGQNLYCKPGEKGSWSPGGKTSTPPEPPDPPVTPTPPVSAPPSSPPAPATPAPKSSSGMCAVADPSSPAALVLLLLALVRPRRRA